MIENLFLSVGAMKAGTTWLYEQLKTHPRIYSTPEKEIHYFEQVSGRSNPISYSKRRDRMIQVLADKNQSFVSNNIQKIQWYIHFGQEEIINDVWYQRLFEEAAQRPDIYCADYSNLYSLLEHKGWERVRQNCKRLRVIYTLRDPLSRIWSHYKFHLQFTGLGDRIIESGTDHFKGMLDNDWFWNHACYDKCLERLNKFLSKEELKIFYFEDFRNKPQDSLNELCNFLEIEAFQLNPSSDKAINASPEISMPAEWEEIAREKLRPTLTNLYSRGINHESWNVE